MKLGVSSSARCLRSPRHPRLRSTRTGRCALIVPFPPGGAVDILGRESRRTREKRSGQTIVIDNRPGVGGAVGSEIAARATADGYTLLMGSTSTISINPALVSKLAYDPVRDFVPITQVGVRTAPARFEHAVPAATLKEFIAYAKSRPGQLAYGSAGNGTPHHIALEMFKQMTGVDLLHVPYKGTAARTGGPPRRTHSRDVVGVLAVLPTFAREAAARSGWPRPHAIQVAPDIRPSRRRACRVSRSRRGTASLHLQARPREITTRLARDIAKSLGTADMRQRFADLGATPVGSTPEESRRSSSAKAPSGRKRQGFRRASRLTPADHTMKRDATNTTQHAQAFECLRYRGPRRGPEGRAIRRDDREIRKLWNEYGIVLLRGQDITPQQLIAYSRRFGELDLHETLLPFRHPDHAELLWSRRSP
jgi:hypothetical protein